jgi:hypothetical protein
MTVQEICSSLQAHKNAADTFALSGSGYPSPVVPDEVLDEEFLSDSVLKVNDVLVNKGLEEGTDSRNKFSSEGELVAQLQANAFLASYQRAATTRKKGRLARLASTYTRTIVNGRDYGPLGGQLNDIGVKVDAPFTSYIIPEEPA